MDLVGKLRVAFSRHRYGRGEYHPDFDLFDAAADEIERLRKIEAAATNVANTLNGGFIACPCGRQDSTTDTDFAPELYEVLGMQMADN